MLKQLEQERQLEFPLEDVAGLEQHLNIPANPESQFLNTAALTVYPWLKSRYADISIREIQEVAEQFRGARVPNFMSILLTRAVEEHHTIKPVRSESLVQLSFSDITPVTTAPPRLPLLHALQGPLKLLGIKS